MVTIEIQVEEDRLDFVLELLRQLDGVKIVTQMTERQKAELEFPADL